MKQFVYIASSESQQIHVWKMDNQGMLTLLQVVNTPGQGRSMVIHPAKTHLYIGIRPHFSVVIYQIDEQGLLIEVGIALLPGSPTQLTTDLYGETLYSVSYGSNCLAVSPIDKHGIVGVSTQILKNLIRCHSANVDITNQVLWVPCLQEDRIRLYNIDETGHLKPRTPKALNIAAKSGPRHMVFHHSGAYAYVINEFSSTINVIATGGASASPYIVQTLDIMPTGFSGTRWAADIHITPDGHWIYCCDRTANIISRFKVSENGRFLHLLGHQATESQPRSFSIDSQGQFLISSGQKSHCITVYSIDTQSGLLAPLARYTVGRGPVWVSVLARH